MTTDTPASEFAETVNAYVASITAAEQFTDPDLNPAAAQRRRLEMTTEAHTKLRDNIADAPDLGDDPRPAALDNLNPQTADRVAVLGSERDTVRDLLDAGHNFARIIDRANLDRATAIYVHRETLTLNSPEPEEAAAEIERRVFDRFTELGEPRAVAAAEQYDEWNADNARRDVLLGLVGGGVSTYALTILNRLSPEEYAAIHAIHAAAPVITRAARDVKYLASAI